MKPSSAKNKGRVFQQHIRDRIRDVFQLEDDDVRSTSMGAGGEDVQLSPAARRKFPYQIEAKSRAAISIFGMYEQAQSHGRMWEPLLIVKQNRCRPLAVVDLEHFLQLTQIAQKTQWKVE